MGNIEHSPKLWAIQFSNGWRYTNDPASVEDARSHDLPVVEYVPAEQLRGAVEALRNYGRHHPTRCARIADYTVPCDCGWSEVVDRYLRPIVQEEA